MLASRRTLFCRKHPRHTHISLITLPPFWEYVYALYAFINSTPLSQEILCNAKYYHVLVATCTLELFRTGCALTHMRKIGKQKQRRGDNENEVYNVVTDIGDVQYGF